MNNSVLTEFAYNLVPDDLFWMAGRMYRVASVRENEFGTWTIIFFDNQDAASGLMMMRVPTNTPFEIQNKQ